MQIVIRLPIYDIVWLQSLCFFIKNAIFQFFFAKILINQKITGLGSKQIMMYYIIVLSNCSVYWIVDILISNTYLRMF